MANRRMFSNQIIDSRRFLQIATGGFADGKQVAPKMATAGCPSIVEVSIGEYSLGEESKVEDSIPPTPQWERKPKRTSLEIPPKSETGFSDKMQEAFETWLQYKKEKNQTYKPTGLKTFIKKLKFSVDEYGEPSVIDMLEKAISSGYAGPVVKKCLMVMIGNGYIGAVKEKSMTGQTVYVLILNSL